MVSLPLLYSKRKFLLLIFANLIVQLGITYYIMERTNVSIYERVGFWAIFILQICIIYLLASLVDIHPIFKFILFSIFSGLTGLHLTQLKVSYDAQTIKAAIESALGIFGAMFAFGISLVLFGVQLGPKIGATLLVCLIALIIARLISIMRNTFNKILSVITVILFSAYVIYDTNIILHRNYYGDFITASLSYYLDIINLFTGSLNSH
jgi:FtsH-binding integral membrane protein